MAENNEPPPPCKTDNNLRVCLLRSTNPKYKGYRLDFVEALEKINPAYLPIRTPSEKSQLLKIARTTRIKPKRKDLLYDGIYRKSNKEFRAELQKLCPHWFPETRTKPKTYKEIMQMAKDANPYR